MPCMKTTLHIFLLALLLQGLSGCKPNSYGWKVSHDLNDFFHFRTSSIAFGGYVNVGELILGYEAVGSPKIPINETQVGFGGIRSIKKGKGSPERGYNGLVAGLAIPFSRLPFYEVERVHFHTATPTFFSVGFDLALVFSFGVQVDAVEFVDLLPQLVGFDLFGDSYQIEKQENKDKNYNSSLSYLLDHTRPPKPESKPKVADE